MLNSGGLFVGMEFGDFACGENSVDVDLDSVLDATSIATRKCSDDRDVSLARLFEYAFVSRQ